MAEPLPPVIVPQSIEQETLAVLKEIRDSALRSEKFLHDMKTELKQIKSKK